MALTALTGMSPADAAQILAAAALLVSPSAGADVRKWRTQAANVIDEARSRASGTPESSEVEISRKVNEILALEIKQVVFPDQASLDDVIERLFKKDLLPLGAKSIKLGKGDTVRRSKKSHILAALEDAEFVQPMPPKGANGLSRDAAVTTIYAKRIVRQDLSHFWMLVQARVQRRQLVVENALEVFPSAVDLDGIKTAVEGLFRFSKHYGVPFSVSGYRPAYYFSDIVLQPSDFSELRKTLGRAEIGLKLKPRSLVALYGGYADGTGEEYVSFIVTANMNRYWRDKAAAERRIA